MSAAHASIPVSLASISAIILTLGNARPNASGKITRALEVYQGGVRVKSLPLQRNKCTFAAPYASFPGIKYAGRTGVSTIEPFGLPSSLFPLTQSGQSPVDIIDKPLIFRQYRGF
ncbi:2110_t:CDS:1, partial [Acaulospora colombiana]